MARASVRDFLFANVSDDCAAAWLPAVDLPQDECEKMIESLIEIAHKYHLPVDPYFNPGDPGRPVDGKRAQYYGHMLQIFVHQASQLQLKLSDACSPAFAFARCLSVWLVVLSRSLHSLRSLQPSLLLPLSRSSHRAQARAHTL